MPIKSVKTSKRDSSKTTSTRLSKASTIQVEVVSESPDLMSAEVVRQISSVEKQLDRVDSMSETSLLQTIETYAGQAAAYSQHAVRAGASALVYAWGCGKLLNAAKTRLGRGAFGPWRRDHILSPSMSERTSTRYMNLAKQCDDIKALLEWSPSLRQAYIACGILPEPERDAEEEATTETAKKQAILTRIAGMQRSLRTLSDFKGRLKASERTQLTQARKEILALFNQLLG